MNDPSPKSAVGEALLEKICAKYGITLYAIALHLGYTPSTIYNIALKVKSDRSPILNAKQALLLEKAFPLSGMTAADWLVVAIPDMLEKCSVNDKVVEQLNALPQYGSKPVASE